jgi:predicted O-methyltransferase YrrM
MKHSRNNIFFFEYIMLLLDEVFKKYSGPQGTGTVRGTDKATVHSYSIVYEELFGFASRRLDVKSVLEIGVDSGASLMVWAEYFPNAEITGVDISLANWTFGKNHPRIQCLEANALSMNPIEKYDIIIDDGSHEPEDQLRAIEVWSSSLSDKGLMVIEDVNLKKHPHLGAALKWTASKSGLHCEIRDLRSDTTPEDDVLAIISKV